MDSRTRVPAGLTRKLAMALAALVATFAFTAFASAGANDNGTTTLKPDKATFEALGDLGITVSPIGKAKVKGNGIGFPITKVDLSDRLTGTIAHKGGLRFASEQAEVEVKDFLVRIGSKKAKLFASAGDAELRLLNLDLSDAKVRGGGSTVKGIQATLAKPGAEALTATFGAPIAKGTPIGKVKVEVKG